MTIKQSAWDGWEALIEGCPLATGSSPSDALDNALSKLAASSTGELEADRKRLGWIYEQARNDPNPATFGAILALLRMPRTVFEALDAGQFSRERFRAAIDARIEEPQAEAG